MCAHSITVAYSSAALAQLRSCSIAARCIAAHRRGRCLHVCSAASTAASIGCVSGGEKSQPVPTCSAVRMGGGGEEDDAALPLPEDDAAAAAAAAAALLSSSSSSSPLPPGGASLPASRIVSRSPPVACATTGVP